MTDTLVEVLALISSSGRMSKRALRAAQERIGRMIFPNGLARPTCPQPSEREALLRQAGELRALAVRGMKSRAYRKQAAQLEILARELPC